MKIHYIAITLIFTTHIYAADTPGQQVSIVPLKYLPQAAEGCSQIWYDTLGHENHPDYSEIKEDHIAFINKHKNDTTLPIMFVALLSGKPVGMCALRNTCYPTRGRVKWADEHPELTPWLTDFCVAKEHQRKKVGTKLAIFTLTYAKNMLSLQTAYALSESPEITELYKRQKGCIKIVDVKRDEKDAQVFKVDILKALEAN